MIFGIGVDIIEISRIKKSIEKFGDKFLNKIYTGKELDYCETKKNKYQHYAARFAAKEAIYKAMSTGWKKGATWKNIEIYNEPNGMPKVRLFGELNDFVNPDKELQISMSHSDNYVAVVAILYTKNGN